MQAWQRVDFLSCPLDSTVWSMVGDEDASSDSRHHVAGGVDIPYWERVGLLNPALFSHLPSMDQSLFEYEGRGDGERSGHATPWG